MIKIFYLLNAVGQFFLMNYFLNIDYWGYGQKVLYGVFTGRDWIENKIFFPRIVYCDFAIRYLGDNNLNYTVNKSDFFVLFINNFGFLGSMHITC